MLQDEKTIIVFALGLASLIATLFYRVNSKRARFPPGPTGLPILGNAADLPQCQPWLTFSKWAEEYGPIVHLRVLGKSIIILNDVTYAFELLDQRGRQYSNRPRLVMGGELVGWDQGPALIQFGKTWSEYRRLMAQFLGSRSKIDTQYAHILQQATCEFMKDLLCDPDQWRDHGRRFAGAIVLKITYGYSAGDKDDSLVRLVNEAMDQFSETTAPNAFAVDIFPFLRFFPQWFPGTSWKKKAVYYHDTLQAMLDRPYDMVKRQMAAGSATSCFVSDVLDSTKSTAEDERVIKWAAAGIYSGGADTTAAAIETFFLAITLQQDAMRKAQKELDTVLGQGVVPTLAARSRLPYSEAFLAEILRTYTIGPVGLPHVAAQDDSYNGYLIPKDAMILTNNWFFYRDSNVYKNPGEFNPERFIDSEGHKKERDPREILFGYGRRSCPGVHLADASMWIIFVSILAFFDIAPSMKDGKPVLPSGRFLDGSISRPEPFDCAITPREGTAEIIQSSLDEAQ